jgi:hypothetical protein
MKKKRVAVNLMVGLGIVCLAMIGLGTDISQEQIEQSGKNYGLDETYDHVHAGIRLILAYHKASTSFIGTVENTTEKTIKSVRVEVHLSNKTELGPTEPMNLAPGDRTGIKLEAAAHVFSWWKAQVEVGSSEHSEEAQEGEGHEHAGKAYREGEMEEHQKEKKDLRERLSPTDTYDHVLMGMRLTLAYHRASSSFIGSVENITDKTISKVSVKVQLSSGTELDSTESKDLDPGEKSGIKIDATGQVFEWWKVHLQSRSSYQSNLLN